VLRRISSTSTVTECPGAFEAVEWSAFLLITFPLKIKTAWSTSCETSVWLIAGCPPVVWIWTLGKLTVGVVPAYGTSRVGYPSWDTDSNEKCPAVEERDVYSSR